jgi:hypothetical protein
MRGLLIIVISVLLSGCVNVSAQLTPTNPAVTGETVTSSDCVPMILGILIGTATVDQALQRERTERRGGDVESVTGPPIRQIKTIRLNDYGFLGFGARCVEVEGTL